MTTEKAAGDLDYLYGWRWLLPLAENCSIRLYGFEPEEALFWKHAAKGWSVVDQAPADVLIVQGDRCDQGSDPTPNEIGAAEVACVVVGWRRARRWRLILRHALPVVKEYSLLPAADPRVVVPLSSCGHAASALGLHLPGRRFARIALLLARGMASVGNVMLLRSHVLLIATRDLYAMPYGAVQANLFAHFNWLPSDYALYLGRPDEDRKTVVLPLGVSDAESILKVASTAKSRAALNNEAAALLVLSQSTVSKFVPKLGGLVPSDEALTLYQEYRPRLQIGRRELEAAVIRFLGQLAALGGKWVPLLQFLATLPMDSNDGSRREIQVARWALRRRLQDLGDAGVAVWLHRTHGDFAPWNCAWTDRGLFVFDWEGSLEQGLALGDAFYYAIAPPLLLKRKSNAVKTLQGTLRLADQVAEASGLELNSRLYLALWLLGRVGKADLYGELIVLLERSWQ